MQYRTWRIEIWRIKSLFKILTNPKKLWQLPELVDIISGRLEHEEWLDKQRNREKGKSRCRMCRNCSCWHEWQANDLREALGPLYEKLNFFPEIGPVLGPEHTTIITEKEN